MWWQGRFFEDFVLGVFVILVVVNGYAVAFSGPRAIPRPPAVAATLAPRRRVVTLASSPRMLVGGRSVDLSQRGHDPLAQLVAFLTEIGGEDGGALEVSNSFSRGVIFLLADEENAKVQAHHGFAVAILGSFEGLNRFTIGASGRAGGTGEVLRGGQMLENLTTQAWLTQRLCRGEGTAKEVQGGMLVVAALGCTGQTAVESDRGRAVAAAIRQAQCLLIIRRGLGRLPRVASETREGGERGNLIGRATKGAIEFQRPVQAFTSASGFPSPSVDLAQEREEARFKFLITERLSKVYRLLSGAGGIALLTERPQRLRNATEPLRLVPFLPRLLGKIKCAHQIIHSVGGSPLGGGNSTKTAEGALFYFLVANGNAESPAALERLVGWVEPAERKLGRAKVNRVVGGYRAVAEALFQTKHVPLQLSDNSEASEMAFDINQGGDAPAFAGEIACFARQLQSVVKLLGGLLILAGFDQPTGNADDDFAFQSDIAGPLGGGLGLPLERHASFDVGRGH